MYNYPEVNHYGTRNANGIAFMLTRLAKVDPSMVNEKAISGAAITSLKKLALKLVLSLPLFKPTITDNGVETFQTWYNDLAESNNLKSIRVTGVWDEATEAAFNSIVGNV